MGAASVPLWVVTMPPAQVSPLRKLTVSPGLRTIELTFDSDFHGAALEVPGLVSLPEALTKYVVPAAWAGAGRPTANQPAVRIRVVTAARTELILMAILAV